MRFCFCREWREACSLKRGSPPIFLFIPWNLKIYPDFPDTLGPPLKDEGGLSASSDLGCRPDAGRILLSEVRFSVLLLRCGRQQHRRGARLRAYPEQRSAAPQANRPSCKRCAGQQQEPIRRDPQAPKKRVRAPEGIIVLQSGKALKRWLAASVQTILSLRICMTAQLRASLHFSKFFTPWGMPVLNARKFLSSIENIRAWRISREW